ncbi:2-phospho-L-lactate transferase [Saccharothrix sp. ST-888]|uniref:2-phospho-L-lactate transferase n=1 Tax=Saccharothrix sp. ST-888 TaxID=1427391 RepID=UPI0005ECBBB0|nr:2-phospho-L-lactate transferase [Saccharothrix sp. ST-888]KJK55787.1 2-phospho-L-lactate transferase [Saccharothrix sp. ST-888]
MRIVALAGGIGGARFLRGLKAAVAPGDEITVIGNTGDDIHLYGLKVCPDLDTVMYTLGGGIHEEQGWGRTDETWSIKAEMKEYGVGPEWFGLGDRDFATHLVRSQMLTAGYTLSQVTEALCVRWQPGVRLLPMSDDRVETHVKITDEAGTRAVHFQEYWVRLHAAVDAEAIVPVGADTAKPAPGVLDAIAAADVILFPPSNPVVSIGTILAVPGIREAVAAAAAPVVGLSPIIGGAPVRGMADKVLAAVGVETTAEAVARHYGPRGAVGSASDPDGGRPAGLLDGWLVDTADEAAVPAVEAAGITCRAVPLLMTDVEATAAMARAALELAEQVRR